MISKCHEVCNESPLSVIVFYQARGGGGGGGGSNSNAY
jgi:hypothetical protein